MKDRRAHQKIYRARRSAAFKRAGLRSDGKPIIGRKPCGCLYGSCLKCVKHGNKRILMANLIQPMYADYQSGMSLEAVGRKYPLPNGKPRAHGQVGQLFHRRGLAVRTGTKPKLGFGVKIPPLTAKETEQAIARLPRLTVPVELKREWRGWSLAKRRAFIQRLRIRFPSSRPTGPFSKNVQAFVYGDPHIHKIAAQLNLGRNSQTKVIALKPGSEGVIWNGQIYFWAQDCYVRGTKWQPGIGRPLLSHVLWEKTNGKKVPAQTTVIHLDGNKNNFAPANLGLRTMAQCAELNHWKHKPAAEQTPIIERITAARSEALLKKSRARTSALLQRSTGLMAQLTRRKK